MADLVGTATNLVSSMADLVGYSIVQESYLADLVSLSVIHQIRCSPRRRFLAWRVQSFSTPWRELCSNWA